jgi:hypothetical protein
MKNRIQIKDFMPFHLIFGKIDRKTEILHLTLELHQENKLRKCIFDRLLAQFYLASNLLTISMNLTVSKNHAIIRSPSFAYFRV